jgi:hypothetical protein
MTLAGELSRPPWQLSIDVWLWVDIRRILMHFIDPCQSITRGPWVTHVWVT